VITPEKAGSHLFSIGGVAIASPVVQAALSGYSDRAMRVLARRHGAAYSLGEVLLDQLVEYLPDQRKRAALIASDAEIPRW
jgi:tRNA-dihydrouridine synthase